MSPAERIFAHAQELLVTASGLDGLCALTERMILEILQREADQELRDKTIGHVQSYYAAKIAQSDQSLADMNEGRAFSSEVIALIVRVRRKRGDPQPTTEEIADYLGEEPEPPAAPVVEKAVAPTSIIMVPPPKPESHPDFKTLLPAALRYRVGIVTTFFQRWNPRVSRSMPLPFLLSVPFGAHLDRVIEEIIAPAMLHARPLRTIAAHHKWADIDSVAFWDMAESNGYMNSLRKAWQDAWDSLRPQIVSQVAADGTAKTVRRIAAPLKKLRHSLTDNAYVMPEIGNREIDLLASFLDPEYARTPLENAWTKLRQTYEQEMDRRIYQDQARIGALRDSLLACFSPFTNPTAEFLAMLCYWNFPFLSLGFLTAFTHNHGSNRGARERRIPYLMWYLDLPQAEHAQAADDARNALAAERAEEQRRTERDQEEREEQARLPGKSWGN